MITITNTKIMYVHKKQNSVVSVYTNAQWVKPAESIFLTLSLLVGGRLVGK